MGTRTTPRPIWTNAVAERNGLISCERPHQTGQVFFFITSSSSWILMMI
jgi:hypothetical protein